MTGPLLRLFENVNASDHGAINASRLTLDCLATSGKSIFRVGVISGDQAAFEVDELPLFHLPIEVLGNSNRVRRAPVNPRPGKLARLGRHSRDRSVGVALLEKLCRQIDRDEDIFGIFARGQTAIRIPNDANWIVNRNNAELLL